MKRALTLSLLSVSVLFFACQVGTPEHSSGAEDTSETVASGIEPTPANVNSMVNRKKKYTSITGTDWVIPVTGIIII